MKTEKIKNIVLSCVAILSGVALLVSLAFILLNNGFLTAVNGFDTFSAISFGSGIVNDVGSIIGILCILQLIIAVITVIIGALNIFFTDKKLFKAQRSLCIVCFLFSILYFAEGIVWVSFKNANETGGHTTYAWWAVIVCGAMFFAFLMVNYLMKKDKAEE